MASLGIVLMGTNIELRLISLIVRAREVSDEVILLDLGSDDDTIELAIESDCKVIEYDGERDGIAIAKLLSNHELQEQTLVIRVDSEFRLRDLPMLVNRAREKWDVHMSLPAQDSATDDAETVVISSAEPLHICFSKNGIKAMSELNLTSNALDLPQELDVRVLLTKSRTKVTQRESLASASRIGQLFYWMLESKHPLLTFLLPGFILFVVGYQLSGNVLDTYQELNQTTLGIGMAVIAVTLIGLFSMMVGIMLYVMGKQIKQVEAQYDDWPE
jgi:hypothetical protein